MEFGLQGILLSQTGMNMKNVCLDFNIAHMNIYLNYDVTLKTFKIFFYKINQNVISSYIGKIK